ncbi:hypothetical protein FBEOM_2775 [Fusarium beomiforme]|uniref:Uncharacterized protein n=1 Tax=Fusarium beomiforme TaxID=44412 RepID=A0A9P5AR95_9HYPO|nr:hypothetical protein FBEOM_2775 [Fusarium beomiforme]
MQKRQIRTERHRSQTLDDGNTNTALAPNQNATPENNSVVNLGNSHDAEMTSDDDTSLPDIDHIPLNASRSGVPNTSANDQVNGFQSRQSSITVTGALDTAIPSVEPVAPMAQMTDRQENAAPAQANREIIDTERYTSSGRSSKRVQRQDFVETPNFEMEDDSRSSSPLLGRRSDPGSRPSPELGTELPRASHAEISRNLPAVPEPIDIEQPYPATEDITSARQVDEASIAMPPPPRPHPTRPPPKGITRRPRPNIKYSVEESPNNLRIWEHYGRFESMSMSEFQAIHKFHDIESVQFIIKRRGMSWDDRVPKNDEAAFYHMKARFKDLIRDDLEAIARGHYGYGAKELPNSRVKVRNSYEAIGQTGGFIPYEIWIIPNRSPEGSEHFVREQTIAL